MTAPNDLSTLVFNELRAMLELDENTAWDRETIVLYQQVSEIAAEVCWNYAVRQVGERMMGMT